MNRHLFSGVVSLFGLGVWLTLGGGARAQEQPPPNPTPPAPVGTPAPAPTAQPPASAPATGEAVQQEGVEVLTQGPVHEAFAEPAIRSPRPTPVVPRQPPDPIEELPPDQKPEGNNVQWIPGYWASDVGRDDFIWVSGIWRDVPPNQQWTPGFWSQVATGWQWVPGYWQPLSQQQVNYLPQPPDPVVESAPPAPNENSVFVPGCWIYQETRFLWRPGFWITYQPGWVWVPAHYTWALAGYLFMDGYWDRSLLTRGLLFAPVVIDRRVIVQKNWYYQPSYTVSDTFLTGALFVQPQTCHYYFGDYFEPPYQKLGFQSWVDYRVDRRYHDYLFEHLRLEHRDNPRWEQDLHLLYTARFEGRVPRPPRTLVQQNTFLRANRNTANINYVRAVTPLTQVNRTVYKLQRVNQNYLTEERRNIQQFRDVGRERARVEAQVVATHRPVTERTEVHAPIRVDLNQQKTVINNRNTAVKVNTPPHPTLPRAVEHRAADERRSVAPRQLEERRPVEERRPATPAPRQVEERRPPTPAPREIEERRPPTPAPRQVEERRPPMPPPKQIEERRPPTPPKQVEERKPPMPPKQVEERRPPTPPRPVEAHPMPQASRQAPQAAAPRPHPMEQRPEPKPEHGKHPDK
jgi:YXWGXW repeat-containing protein